MFRNEKYEVRPCVQCKTEHKIFNRNKWLCRSCDDARKKSKINRQTNEMDNNDLQSVFITIWKERPHVCYHCRRKLGCDPKPIYFSHILSRGAHPKLRCDPDNIVLACPDCHYIYDFGDRSKLEKQISEEMINKLLEKENG